MNVSLTSSVCKHLMPTSADRCRGGAQDVTPFDAALLHPEGVELRLGGMKLFLCFLV